jgi:hypothetical protein
MSFLKRFALFAAPLGAVALIYQAHKRVPAKCPMSTHVEPVVHSPCPQVYGHIMQLVAHAPVYHTPVKWDHIKINEMLRQQPQYSYSHFEAFYHNVEMAEARLALFHFLVALAGQQKYARPVLSRVDLRGAVTKVFGDVEQTEEICTKYVECMRKN